MYSSPRINVLHISQDDISLQITKEYMGLLDANVIVTSCNTPKKALKILAHSSYDCILTDYIFAETNGLELAKTIIHLYNVPVILYTSYFFEGLIQNAFTIGISDYIKKEGGPDNIRILINNIRHATEKNYLHTLYNDIAENSIDGVTIKQGNTIVYANRAFAELCGYFNVEEVIGRDASDFVSDEEVDKLKEMTIQRQLNVPQPSRFEFKLKNTKGSLIPCEAVARLIKFKGKNASLNQIRDISERKKSKAKLFLSENRYNRLVTNIPDSIIQCLLMTDDKKEITDIAIININPTAEEFFNIKNETVKGKSITILLKEKSNIYKTVKDFTYEIKDSKIVIVKDIINDNYKTLKLYLYKLVRNGMIILIEDNTNLHILNEEKEEQKKRSTKELETLLYSSRLILRNKNFSESAQTIIDSCKMLIKAKDSYLLFYGEEKKLTNIRYFNIEKKTPIDSQILTELGGLVSEVKSSKKVIIDNNFEDRIAKLNNVENLFENVIVAPLIYNKEFIGALCLANKKGGFSDEDLRLVSSFSELLSIAYTNDLYIKELKQNQKQLENATHNLQIEQNKYESIINSAQESLAIFVNNICVYANNQTVELFGAKEQTEILGKDLLTFIDRQYHMLALNRAKKVIENDEAQTQEEVIFKRLDGKSFDVSSTASSIKWYGKKGVLYVWRDITPWKKNRELRLKESNRLNDILSTTTSIAFEIDKENKISYYGNYEHIFGYQIDEFDSSTEKIFPVICKIIHSDDTRRLKKDYRQFIASKNGVIDSIYKIRSKNGLIKYVKLHAVKTTNNKQLEINGLLTDVTEFIHKEKILEHLYKYCLNINNIKTIPLILNNLIETIKEVFEYENIDIGFIKENRLYGIITHGKRSENYLSLNGPGITIRAIKTGKTQNVGDTRRDPDFVSNGNEQNLSELAVPIIIDKKAIGVLNIENVIPHYYTHEDIRLVEMFVEITAMKMHKIGGDADQVIKIIHDKYLGQITEKEHPLQPHPPL